jgi:hypothetical protein
MDRHDQAEKGKVVQRAMPAKGASHRIDIPIYRPTKGWVSPSRALPKQGQSSTPARASVYGNRVLPTFRKASTASKTAAAEKVKKRKGSWDEDSFPSGGWGEGSLELSSPSPSPSPPPKRLKYEH